MQGYCEAGRCIRYNLCLQSSCRSKVSKRCPDDFRTLDGSSAAAVVALVEAYADAAALRGFAGNKNGTWRLLMSIQAKPENCLLSAYGALSLSPDAFETAPAVEDVTVAGVRVPNPKKSFLGQSIAEPGSVCPFRFCCKSPHSRSYYCLELSLHKAYHIYIFCMREYTPKP